MEKTQKYEADYLIDYEKGAIPVGDLPIGARVVDPSWEWEFRTGKDYSGSGEVKPVIWIIVAKDHYDGLGPHVTLLAEELIGKISFDNSTNQETPYGRNHWGESGTADATRGLRPWLNSTGIHDGEGFYRAFSDSFKEAVLETTVPNKVWFNDSAYSTEDKVFLPSTTELGDTAHYHTCQIGTAYPYFQGADDAKRVAGIVGDPTFQVPDDGKRVAGIIYLPGPDGYVYWYWTRSPISSGSGFFVCIINICGEFNNSVASYNYGVRPALNLKSGVLVSEIKY